MDEDNAGQKEERVPNAKVKQSVPKAAKLIDANVEFLPRPPVKSNKIKSSVKENRVLPIISRPTKDGAVAPKRKNPKKVNWADQSKNSPLQEIRYIALEGNGKKIPEDKRYLKKIHFLVINF